VSIPSLRKRLPRVASRKFPPSVPDEGHPNPQAPSPGELLSRVAAEARFFRIRIDNFFGLYVGSGPHEFCFFTAYLSRVYPRPLSLSPLIGKFEKKTPPLPSQLPPPRGKSPRFWELLSPWRMDGATILNFLHPSRFSPRGFPRSPLTLKEGRYEVRTPSASMF